MKQDVPAVGLKIRYLIIIAAAVVIALSVFLSVSLFDDQTAAVLPGATNPTIVYVGGAEVNQEYNSIVTPACLNTLRQKRILFGGRSFTQTTVDGIENSGLDVDRGIKDGYRPSDGENIPTNVFSNPKIVHYIAATESSGDRYNEFDSFFRNTAFTWAGHTYNYNFSDDNLDIALTEAKMWDQIDPVNTLYNKYTSVYSKLQSDFPSINFIHMTASYRGDVAHTNAQLVGANGIIEDYNEKVYQNFLGKVAIFDWADIVSTKTDISGTACSRQLGNPLATWNNSACICKSGGARIGCTSWLPSSTTEGHFNDGDVMRNRLGKGWILTMAKLYCQGTTPPPPPPPTAENCTDGIDNDSDNLIDCHDSDCSAPTCAECKASVCSAVTHQWSCSNTPDGNSCNAGQGTCLAGTCNSAGNCKTSSSSWNNNLITAQTGEFITEFNAVPNGNKIDSVTALSPANISTWSNTAVLVRFNPNGFIDARNGGNYGSINNVPYSAGTKYHFRINVNVPAKTYDTYVTPFGGSEVQISDNFSFRTEQAGATKIANWGINGVSGTHSVCDLVTRPATTQATCGDGITQNPEQCDDGNTNNNDACLNTCLNARCGDSTIKTGAEQCDDTVLGGKTCNSQGFIGGTLSCRSDCTLDESKCLSTLCGNGAIDSGEACDGIALGGKTCNTLGYAAGTLSCKSDCTLDQTQCVTSVCGNGKIEGNEQCDETALGGSSCTTYGYTSGTLKCNGDCTVNKAGCTATPSCGNGIIDSGEQCDGSTFYGNASCASIGKAGSLKCTPSCLADASECYSTSVCGNSKIESGEQCDDGNTSNRDSCSTKCQTCTKRTFYGFTTWICPR